MASHTNMLERETTPIRAIQKHIDGENSEDEIAYYEHEGPEIIDDTESDSSGKSAEGFSRLEDAKLLELLQQECSPEFWSRLGSKFHRKKDGPSVRLRTVKLMN